MRLKKTEINGQVVQCMESVSWSGCNYVRKIDGELTIIKLKKVQIVLKNVVNKMNFILGEEYFIKLGNELLSDKPLVSNEEIEYEYIGEEKNIYHYTVIVKQCVLIDKKTGNNYYDTLIFEQK